MKILNYLNVSELINEIKKNNLSTNIIFISSLILPFSFFFRASYNGTTYFFNLY